LKDLKDLKNISIDTELTFSDDSFVDDRYIKCRIKTCHNGINKNLSNFEDDVIANAEWSLKNIFILANVVEDENGILDFNSHDYYVEESRMVKDEWKIIYEELPVGILPESNNYEYKKDEDSDGYYVYADALIVRDYSNYAEDIVKRYIAEGKPIKVSMEIAVDEYKVVNSNGSSYYDILKYKYLAITMLGNKFSQGMAGAKAVFDTEDNQEQKVKFMEKIEELKSLFSDKQEKEGETMAKTKAEKLELEKLELEKLELEKLELEKLELAKLEAEKALEALKPDATEDFSLTSSQKFNLLNDSIQDDVIRNEEGDCISAVRYWVRDYNDEYVFVNRYSWGLEDNYDDNVRGTYTIGADETTANIDKVSFEVVVFEPITKVEKDLLESARKETEFKLTELEDIKCSLEETVSELETKVTGFEGQIEEFNSTITDKDLKIEKLEAFKLDIEKQINDAEIEAHKIEIDYVIEEFVADLGEIEEFVELKSKAYDMSEEELRKECFAILGKTKHKKINSKKPAKFNKSMVSIKLDSNVAEENKVEPQYEKYSDEIKRLITKTKEK
jgi:uncharacterized coiled-coil protein SlyX